MNWKISPLSKMKHHKQPCHRGLRSKRHGNKAPKAAIPRYAGD
jgi:hypothetical protein